MSTLKVGFTGTRKGMTEEQLEKFSSLVHSLEMASFHHGACKGADAEAVQEVLHVKGYLSLRGKKLLVHAHPGKSAMGGENHDRDNDSYYASDLCEVPETHFVRNRRIVDLCDLLVACPWQNKEQEPEAGTGGGTWYTIQYAMKVGKPIRILWPDGTVEER